MIPQTRRLAPYIAIGVACVVPFLIAGFFGVNVTVYDEWPQFFYYFYREHNALSFDQLWLDGNLHRQFFSRLFSLASELVAAGNAKFEMYADAGLMIGAFAVLAAHLRRQYHFNSSRIAVIALIVLSGDQIENITSGCDNSSDLVLMALVGAGVLLDIGTIPAFAVALVPAVIGSYSLFQGLFVWPAGAVLLALNRRWTLLALWVGLSAIDMFFYFDQIHWEWANPTRVPLTQGLFHPIALAGFALGMFGTVTGSLSILNADQLSPAGWWIAWISIAGAALVALTAAVVRTIDTRRPETPLAAYFATTAILFVIVTTFGRVSSGWYGANVSRYATLTMLLLVALWIVTSRVDSRLRQATATFVIFAYVTSLGAAVSFAAQTRHDRLVAIDVLRNLAVRPSVDVVRYLGYPNEVRVVRSFAEFEFRKGLGSFASGQTPAKPSAVGNALVNTPMSLSPACEHAIRATYLADGARLATRPLDLPASYDDEPSCRSSVANFMAADEPGIVPSPGSDFFLNGGLAWDDGPPADVHVWGDGTTLDLYASMKPIEPTNLRAVKLSAIADDRSVHSGQMCIYAAWDGGASPQTCVRADGTMRRIETPPISLDTAKPFSFVAHFFNVAPDYGRLVSFDDPLILPMR